MARAWKAVILLTLLCPGAAVAASDGSPCLECDTAFAALRTLGEQVHEISGGILAPELPQRHALAPNETEDLLALSSLERGLRTSFRCEKREGRWRPRVSLEFRAVGLGPRLADAAPETPPHWSGTSLFDHWLSLRTSMDPPNCAGRPDVHECVDRFFTALRERSREVLAEAQAEDFERLRDRMTEDLRRADVLPSGLGEDWDRRVLTQGLTLRRMLLAPDWQGALAGLRATAKYLDDRDRIAVVSGIGGLLLSGYDRKRLDPSDPASQGIVPESRLFSAMQWREFGSRVATTNFEADFPEDRRGIAGVCRDMAVPQAQAAEALGFRNAYVIGYRTRTSGWHAIVALEDPSTGRAYAVNYDTVSDNGGAQGATRLEDRAHLNLASDTQEFRVYRSDGMFVGSVPSEGQLVQLEGLRGLAAAQELAPGYLPRGHLAAASVELADGATARIYQGQDSRGQTYAGIGVVGRVGSPERAGLSGEIGVALNHLRGETVDSQRIFGFYDALLRTRDRTWGERERLRVHAYARATGSGIAHINDGQTDPDSDANAFLEGNARIAAGTRLDWRNPENSRGGSIRAESRGLGTVETDARVAGGGLRVIHDRTLIEGRAFFELMSSEKGRDRLARSPEGRAYLFGAATAIVDAWGPMIQAAAGVERAGSQIELRYQGRTRADSPLFREGAARRLSLTGSKRLDSGAAIQAQTVIPLERTGDRPTVRLGAKIFWP